MQKETAYKFDLYAVTEYSVTKLDRKVPGAGVEPARIAPSVFETDASTDSAIRAYRMQS